MVVEESKEEQVVSVIEAKSRKEKLGGFFGATGNEIDKGIKEAKITRSNSGRISKIGQSPPTNDREKLSLLSSLKINSNSSGNLFNLFNSTHKDSSPTVSRKSVAVTKMLDQVQKPNSEPVDVDKHPLTLFLYCHPGLAREDREFVKSGPIIVQFGESEKSKEYFLFLFNDLIVISKKKANLRKSNQFTEEFKLVQQILLEHSRIILIGNDAKFGDQKSSFQISFKNVTYTFTPVSRNVAESEAIRDDWFNEIKKLIKGYQKTKLSNSALHHLPK